MTDMTLKGFEAAIVEARKALGGGPCGDDEVHVSISAGSLYGRRDGTSPWDGRAEWSVTHWFRTGPFAHKDIRVVAVGTPRHLVEELRRYVAATLARRAAEAAQAVPAVAAE